MAGFNDAPLVEHLAVPAVCLLMAFLSCFSQYVFCRSSLEPGPPSRAESAVFNTLLLCLWYAYYKAVTVDPGRFVFAERAVGGGWCNKCAAPKPPRAHHCRHCRRCIPKMDHHCPWTRNCVSMTTFPHFLRFLVYANASLWMLAYLLWQRFYALWETRHLPAYLGPSLQALVALALTSLLCFFTSFALGIMLVTTVKSWLFNCTMIEGWQLERHQAAIDRGGRDWWDVTGPDGAKLRFERVEFPYDIGIFANMAQAMGTPNVLFWLLPLSGGPAVGRDGHGVGWEWEENGFNRDRGMWPPPDPEKMRLAAASRQDCAASLLETSANPEELLRAFKERQCQDAKRRNILLAELEEVDDYDMMDEVDDGDDDDDDDEDDDRQPGGPRWINSDGERLRDYGVDEDAEDADAEARRVNHDEPISKLLRRRNPLPRREAD